MNIDPSPSTLSAFTAAISQYGYNSTPLLIVTRTTPPVKFVSWIRDADNDVISIPIIEEADDPLLDSEIVKEVITSLVNSSE